MEEYFACVKLVGRYLKKGKILGSLCQKEF